MAIVEYESLKGLSVITQDAYILGEVLDIRYEDLTWNIQGIKIKSESKVSKMISVGSGKSKILLQPGRYSIADVIVLPDTVNDLKKNISTDNNNFKSVSSILGMKVMSSENVLIGTVDSVQVNLDNWTVVSMKVKLDKGAYAPLEIKKGLLGKKISGLLMTDISEMGDVIKLNLNLFSIRGQVVID